MANDRNWPELRSILRRGEGERLEFKRSLSESREILETICAFANAKGGLILIGVDDNGEPVGVEVGRRTLENLENRIHSHIDPHIYPRIRVKAIQDKTIVAVEVPEGTNKPYFYKGRAYLRIGRSNRLLGRNGIERLMEARPTFDSLPSTEGAEIDENLVVELVERARDRRGMKVKFEGVTQTLKKLRLLRKGKLTNAAILLFSPDATSIFPQAAIKAAYIRGGKIEDETLIEGPILRQVEEAMDFVKKHIRKSYIVTELERKEVWEYPLEAVREAIVNATIHRDYRSTSTTRLKITEKGITVENPGELPPPLKPSDLKKEHPSIPRNPRIARTFYYWGYFEEWGSGTLRMIEQCRKAGLPDPEFTQKLGFFQVAIWNRKKYEEELTETERKVLEIIRIKGETTRREIQKYIDVSERTVRRALKKLESLGLIRKTGKGKNTKYKKT